MVRMKLADYLFRRIKEFGVDCTFGIPGDFVLPVYAAQERAGLKTVVMTHEPSVGFAADAYARLRGLGVALVTYGAGGLNMVNPVGLAYAEESPVLVISGGPETRFRSGKPYLHHCVKTFDTQYKVFAEVTESHTILSNPTTAQEEIDRVIDTTLRQSRPGYIEIPRDLVNVEIETSERAPSPAEPSSPALEELTAEIMEHIRGCERLVLMVGAEARRFGLHNKVVALAEALNCPVVTSILGKASFPESHANFIGTYFGQFANPKVREYVESADCVICLGAVLTEMESGGYTAQLDQRHLIQIIAREVSVGYHTYSGIDLPSIVNSLVAQCRDQRLIKRFSVPAIEPEHFPHPDGNHPLLVADMIDMLNSMLSDKYSVISDVGDCLYASLSLKTNIFIAPGYYSSMGFGVPAAIGASVADPSRRAVVLVGDGGFQMTGMEMSTAVKLGIAPVIIVFNNASYAMLRFVDQQRDYYKLQRWDYAALARAVGGDGTTVKTSDDFAAALQKAQQARGLFLIDAQLSEDDISPTLRRLTDHFGKKVKAAISG